MRTPYHSRQRIRKDFGHLIAGQSLLGEEKGPNTRRLECGTFNRIASNTAVLGKDDPTIFANGFEPFNIGRCSREVIGKHFNMRAEVAQPSGDQFAAQAVVDEEGDAGE